MISSNLHVTGSSPDLKVEERWVTLDGVRVRYLHAGSGPPLVLLHGLLGYSFSWRHAIPLLAAHATIYAVDMPGAGFSERCSTLDCSFRGSANRLLSFVEQVRLGSFDLLGTSHGGAVAMMAAAIAARQGHPQIPKLVLVAPVNPWSIHGRQIAHYLSGRIVSIIFRKVAPYMSAVHERVLRRLYGDPRRISPGTLEGYSKPFAIPGTFEYGLQILSTWSRDLQELQSTLPSIADIPTLLIWGSKDAAVDPASAHSLAKQFQNCRVVMMEGVGHLPYEELPQQFSEAVIDFLYR